MSGCHEAEVWRRLKQELHCPQTHCTHQLAANELKTITCAPVYQALLFLLSSSTLLLKQCLNFQQSIPSVAFTAFRKPHGLLAASRIDDPIDRRTVRK